MIQPKDPEELRLLEEEPGLQPKVEQPQAPPPTPSFLQLPKELLSGVSHSALLKVGACVLLCLQNSSYTLLRRYSSGVLKERASSQSILAAGEAMKLGFSAIMVWRESSELPKVRYLAATSAKMAIPALIFLLMNLLSFVSLRRISASAFSLIQQSKIIFTAALSWWLLDKLLSRSRWRALATLLFAVLTICHQTHPQNQKCAATGAAAAGADDDEGEQSRRVADYLVGVAAVALEAALSGLSNVYFEKVLKSTDLTLWERNIQLAVFSLCIYLPYAMLEAPSPLAILHGWSLTTVVVAILGALGGILIGLVLSFSDSIVKNLALSFAITLTALVDHLLFDGPMNLPIVVSGATVITSILQYTDS